MGRSKPATAREYLASLTPQQRQVVSAVRDLGLEDLPFDVIEKGITSTPPDELITRVKAVRRK